MSSLETNEKDISDRLGELRNQEGLSQTEMGSLVGRSQQTWGAYESGDSTPPLDILQFLLVEFDLSADWLLTGQGKMEREETAFQEEDQPSLYEEVPERFDPDTTEFVPVYGAPLGAGQAGNADMVQVRAYMAWEKRWLRREAKIDPDRAFAAQVYGQSMINLLENGDLVFGEQKEVVDHDGIYAVRVEDQLFVKHALRRTREIHLVSENDVYDRITVTKQDDFSVIGRVVGRVSSI